MPTESSRAWLRALQSTAPISRNPLVTLPVIIERLAEQFGHATALISAEEHLSYRDLAARVRYYAQWAIDQRLGKGDVVCLLMQNCPDYLAIWLGITRVGSIVALLNTNLRGAALRHSIALVAPRHAIVGEGLHDAYISLRNYIWPDTNWWTHKTNVTGLPRVDDTSAFRSSHAEDMQQLPNISDTALYLYTSGTTGLPKAAPISHYRLMQWTHWFAGMMNTTPADRMYNCLPMYHSVGGIVATGATLVGGGSLVLRQKFSAREFWPDITEWDCTLFQYIGEICRFLLKSPVRTDEKRHRIRLACGNGLAGGIWEEIQERFQIPHVLEFYASTEGNVSLYNCEGQIGAVGRLPPFISHRSSVEILRCDLESGVPFRKTTGFCERCDPDEPGHAVGRITAETQFLGYTDHIATEKKIIRDVFAKGDAWFSTGDLLKMDRKGYFYFVDRIGDTFRWKGENVSTGEVASLIESCTGITQAIVYGVKVPHTDGRVGMAAIVTERKFNLSKFQSEIAERLPIYARPVFLRICPSMEYTGTFKPQKQRLIDEGYDPNSVSDKIYLSYENELVTLDSGLHDKILRGQVRF